MKLLPLLVVFSAVIFSCTSTPNPQQKVQYKAEVQAVLNDWHNAAAEADFDRYFGYFADSSSIFMGTDATERWNLVEFKEYSEPVFARGRAWNFTPVTRFVNIANDGQTAWFDEELSTPNLGPSRGTGVLVLKDGNWKIAHYSLTVPIPNSIMNDVKNQIEQALSEEH